MQWAIAFVAACLCFWVIQNLEKPKLDNQKPDETASAWNNKIILFFFIVVIFQIVFYYLDIASYFKGFGVRGGVGGGGGDGGDGSGGGGGADGGAAAAAMRHEILKLSRSQQDAFEKEIIRGIRQDINIGSPPF